MLEMVTTLLGAIFELIFQPLMELTYWLCRRVVGGLGAKVSIVAAFAAFLICVIAHLGLGWTLRCTFAVFAVVLVSFMILNWAKQNEINGPAP